MKKIRKQWRKPLSLVLALCMFMSAASVGLTVFAADLAENRSASGKTLDGLEDLGLTSGAEATTRESTKTELETVTEYVNRYKTNKNDTEAENWLWNKLIENLKKGYESNMFKQDNASTPEIEGGMFWTNLSGVSGVNQAGSIRDDAEGTAYNTLTIYWALQLARMTYAGSSGDSSNWLGGIYNRVMGAKIKEYLNAQGKGSDYDTYGMEFTLLWISSQNNTGANNQYTTAHIVRSVAPENKTYLTWYKTVADIPSTIPTEYGAAVAHKNYGSIFNKKWGFTPDWKYAGSNATSEAIGYINGNDNRSARMDRPDTTSKATLTGFQNTFTNEVLNISDINDINSYTPEQFAAIYSSKAVIDDIKTMDASVGEHFFGKATDIYEGDPFTRATEIYNAVVELTQSAYENFQTKVAELDTKYGGAYALTIDDIGPMKAGLDSAIAFYNIIDPAKVNDDVIVVAKSTYDTLLTKYANNKEGVYQAALPEKLNALYQAMKQTVTVDGKEYKISEFVKSDSSTVAFDNVPAQGAGFIKTAADLYYLMGKILIGGGTLADATPSSVLSAIKNHLANMDGYSQDDFDNYGMATVLAGFSQVSSTTGFAVVSNPLLYTYNNIGEIADNAISQKTTYAYSLDENGKITSDEKITQKTIQVPDRKAKTNFNLWTKNFDAVSVAQDLTKMDSTALKLSLEKSKVAVDAVKSYDIYVKAHLLGSFGYTFEQGEARIAEIVKAIVDNFTTRATSFNAEYADMTVVASEADYDKFFKKYDDIVGFYNLIESKTPEIEALKAESDRLNGIACSKKYLDDVKKVDSFYKAGSTTEFAPFTSRTITLANDLIKAMKKHYIGILPADINNPDIVAGKAKQTALETAVNAYMNGSTRTWEQTSMSYDGVENASIESLRGIISNIDGVFQTDVLNTILGPILNMDLPEGMQLNEALFDQIINMICANGDTIANAIIQMIGPALHARIEEIGQIAAGPAESAGLAGYPDRVANKLGDYPQVYNELKRAGANWTSVDYSKMVWVDKNGKTLSDYAKEGKGVEAFVQLIGSAVAPFWGVFRALLNNNPTKVLGIVEAVPGYPGLNNVVFPILLQLGIGKNPNDSNQEWKSMYCRAFTLPNGSSWGASTNNPDAIAAMGNKDDTWQTMGKLLIPLFDWLKNEVLASPVESVTKLLPKLAEMMASNRIVEGLNKITAPLGDPTIVGGLTSSIDLTSVNGLLEMVFPDKKIILPNGATINLPELDQGLLAGLAKQKTKTDVGAVDITNGYSKALNGGTNMVGGIALDTSETYDQVLFYLLKYVTDVLKNNEESISSLFGDQETAITKYLKTALSKDSNAMTNSLIGVLMNKEEIKNDDWDMATWKFDEATADYGDVTNDQARKALENIDKLINSVVKIALSTDLKSLVGNSLYTDATMSSIVSLFKMIGTDQLMPILKMLGIDVSVKAVADNLSAYPEIANYLKTEIEVTDDQGNVTKRLRTWAEVDLTGISWGFSETSTSADFATAIAKVFKPFNSLLATLFAGKDFPVVGGVVSIKGANGYANSLLPLLNGILGCDALSADAFKTAVDADPDMLIASIIKPVLDKVDKILESPVGTLADVLPNLAYFIDNGGLSRILKNLLKPITQVTDEILPLLEVAGKTPNVFEVIETILLDNPAMSPDVVKILELIDFSDPAFLDKAIVPVLQNVLSNLTIGGTTLNINLPNIDWGKLAGMGKQTADGGIFQRIASGTNHIEADRGAVGVTLMNYVFRAVVANKDMILGMLGGVDLGALQGTVVQFLTNVLSNEPAVMTSALIRALSVDNPADDDWNLGDFTLTVTDKLYKDEEEQRIKEAVAKTDILLAGVLSMVVPDAGSIEELVKGYISDATIKALFQPIYTALDGKQLKDILAKLGLKTSPKDLALALKNLGNVAVILEKYETWAEVFADPDWATASFGVDANNAEETFAIALSKMFAPFEGILQALLVKKDFAIAGDGGYEIKGANGYNNSILPILGALGATSEDGILTSDEMMAVFAKDATDPNAEKGVLYNIVKPALNTVFRLANSPVTFLANMLPNFALFMEKGALTDSVMNLLKPITQISDIIVGLDSNFGSTQEFVMYLLGELNVTLPEGLDLENIEGSILDVVNGFLANGIQINETTNIKIQLPEFEWKTLAGRGELAKDSDITFMMNAGKGSKQYVKADSADAYMAVLNYLALTATSNKAEILKLLQGLVPTLSPEIVDLITKLLENDPKVIAEAIMHVISTGEITDDEWDMSDFVHKVTDKVYADDSDRVNGAITKTDDIINGVLSNLAGMENGLSGLLTGNFSDANAKELFKLVFNALSTPEISSVMDTLAFDLSPKAMKTVFEKAGFADFATFLNTAIEAGDTTWTAIFARADWATATFGVTDSYSFAQALSAMFVPFDGVIKALAVKGNDYQALDLYTVRSANGYKTSILPILGALGCTEADGIKTADEFAADLVAKPDQGALFNIIRPVLKMAERASANPVNFLTGMLPNFAFFMDNNGLTRSLTNLIKPITNITDQLIPLFNLPADSTSIDLVKYLLGIFVPTDSPINDILSQVDFEDLEGSIMNFAYKFLKDGIAINETTTIKIDLPVIDWGILAGRGELKTSSDAPFFAKVTGDKTYKYVEADKGEVFMAVLTYIADTVKKNWTEIDKLLASLLGDTYATIKPIIDAIISNDSKDIADAIMHVINTKPITDDDWSLSATLIEAYEQLYKDNEELRARLAVTKIDNMLKKAIEKFVPSLVGGIPGALTGAMSNANAKAVFDLVYNALGSAETASLMKTLKLDVSASAVMSAFATAGLGNIATIIGDAITANANVTMAEIIASDAWATADFGVTGTDTFAKALSTMFVPFNDLLKALLIKGNDYAVAGIYDVKSSNGYLEAVLPILGALGCTIEDGVLSAEAFATADNSTYGVLYNIINPVLNMAVRATENPVAFLTKMLPNFAFFMENKGLTNSLTSLLKPITNITDELIPLFGLEVGATSFDLVKYFLGIFVPVDSPVNDLLGKIDFEDLEGSIMNFVYKFLEDGIAIDETTTISIDLPKIDWAQLANRGVLKKDGTSPFMAGTDGKYKYIEADQEEVLMAVLTYVAQTVLDNEVQIISLLKTLLGDTYTTLEPIITALLNNDAKTIADAIMHVISTKNITDFDWSTTELLQEALTAIYTGDEEKRVKEAISKLDTMIETAISKFVPSLVGGIPGALTGAMSNANAKTVFDLVYKALGSAETANLMKTLDFDVSAAAVKSAFETAGLGNIATIIGEAITANANVTMAEIIASDAWATADFGVTGTDTFAKALSTMFVPFNDLLKALLIKGDDYAVAGIYEVKSSNGYLEAVLPILGALGCADALSADEFKESADNDTYGVLYNIINPILKMAVKATEKPIDFLTKMLPNFAFFMDNKGLTKSLTNLLKPITNITDELVPLFGLEEGATSFDLVKTLLGMFVKDDAIMSIVNGIDFEDVEGSVMNMAYDFLEGGIAIDETTTITLEIPRIDWAKLAGRGELKENADAPFLAKITGDKTYKYVEADQEEVLMAVLTYFADVVLTNADQVKDLLKGLLGDTYATLETLIDAIFKSNSKDLADAIMHIIATKPIEDDEWNMSDFVHDVSDIIYASGEAERVNGAIVKVEAMLDVALKKFANLEGGINGILTGALNGETVKTLFNAVYGALGTVELTGTMKTLGIDLSASAVKTAFETAGLGNIATIIGNAITANANVTMAEIIASDAWATADFGVAGTDTFAKALSTMFVPFDGVLGALLAGESFEVAGIYEIKGAKGYKNSVLPIFGALGCTAEDGVLTADEFAAADTKFGILYNIINPVVKMADRASKAPIDFLTKMLPNFAFFMDNGGLTRAVTNLVKPLTNITDEILPVLKDLPGLPENATSFDLVKALLGLFVTDDSITSIVDSIDLKDLEGSIMNMVYGLLEKEITIGETKITLKIPEIDWHTLAGRGELKTTADAPFLSKVTGDKTYKYVEADQADSFMAVLKYIATVVTTNSSEIQKLIGSLLAGMEDGMLKDTVNGMITTVLGSKPEDIANAIMHVLNTTDIPDDNWDMTSFIFQLTTGMLGGNVTSEEVLEAIGIVDETAGKFITQFFGADLTTMVKGSIYTDSNVSAIFTGLFGALGSADISNVLSTFGIDVSVGAMKTALKEYPEITAILAKYTSMADAAGDPALATASWKITDKNSFANAIAAVLSPFNSVLKALLIKDSANDFDIMNMYKIKSSNGYSESVLPLFAALGCTEMKSAADYKKAVKADDNALIAEIIKPILALVEKVAGNPVDTIATILPNIAYFINNDGITRVLTNLIKPLSNVLDEIIPIITVPSSDGNYPKTMEYVLGMADTFVPNGIGGIKVSEIIGNTKNTIVPTLNAILSGVDVMGQKIEAPDIDFGVLAGCGKLIDNADAPFLAKILGKTNFKYVEADKSQSTMAVLNYLVKTLQLNQDALISIVSGLIKDNEALSSKIVDIIKMLLDNEPSSISGALIKVITYKGDEDYQWKDMIWEVAMAVYPAGITGDRVATTAKGIDTVLKNALDVLLNTSLPKILDTSLYTNANVSAIVKALYGAVGTADIQAITAMFGVDTSVGSFSDAIAKSYPKIATMLAGKTDWAQVDLSNANWAVSDANSFSKALATILSPFNNLLKFFLVSGNELVVMDSLTLHSGDGYKNAIVPFLNALGCENIMSGEDYEKAIAKDETAMLTAIINPVLELVGKIAKNPVVTLSTILPNFAYFMDNHGITQMVNALILPVTGMVQPIVSLITKDSIISFVIDLLGIELPIDVNNLENEIVPLINGIMGGIEINGKPLGLQIPEFSWHKLAGFGKLAKDGKVVANIDDVAVSLFSYIASIPSYKNNGSAIINLLGENATGFVGDIIHNAVTASPSDLVSLIVDLFDPTDDGLSGNWSYKSIKSSQPKYTPNLSEQDFSDGIVAFDSLIPSLINSFAGGGTLQSLVANGVFTNKMVNTIGGAVFGLLGSESVAGILGTVADVTGIDLTPSGVASNLTGSRFSNARKAMNSASTWADVDFTKINWGFKDGEQDAFLETVVAMFRPALEVLQVVLNGKDFVLLDGVVIKGADGYNNAIIPLLQALCCDNILTQKQYADAINKNADNTILAILKPIMAKLNDLLVAPMDTLTQVLPNVGYFMYNDGLAQLLDNILLPINKILKSVSPVYALDLNSILGSVKNINVPDALNGALAGIKVNGKPLGIKINQFSWENLAACGTSAQFTSAQVNANGKVVTATRIDSNKPQTFVTVMRYLIETIQDPGNLVAIQSLLDGVDLGSLGSVVTSLLASIGSSDVDSVIEMLFASLLGIGVVEEEVGGIKPKPVITSSTNAPTTTAPAKPATPNTTGAVTAPTQPAPTDDGNKVNLPLIIGLAIAGLLLLGLAIWLIIFLRKKKNAQEALGSATTIAIEEVNTETASTSAKSQETVNSKKE